MNRLVNFTLVLSLFCFLAFPASVKSDANIDNSYDMIIDVGHGGIDGGTSAHGILEKDINLAIGLKLYEALKKKGFAIGITRMDDYALSDDSSFHFLKSRHRRDLEQRKLIADTLRPTLFLSIHVNWSKNKHTRGPLVIYQPNEASFHLAQIIQDHLNMYYGVEKSPLKGKSYFLMKMLEIPSVIIELGYLSNDQDMAILTEEHTQDQLVNRLVQALSDYFILFPV